MTRQPPRQDPGRRRSDARPAAARRHAAAGAEPKTSGPVGAGRRSLPGGSVRVASPPAAFDRAALSARLRAGLAALGLDESPAERLLDYLGLLVKWNSVYNLTAVRDPGQMLTQHLLDSLSIVAPLAGRMPDRGGAPAGWIVDVGSGAGLPGIVLAIVWPQAEVLLVEPVGKKAAFLRQCRGELALTNVDVAATRVETLGDARRQAAPDLIVCRAFASLADYVTAIDRLAGPQTVVAAMKGVLPDDEIASLPAPWTVAVALPLCVPELAAARHLLLLQRSPQAAPAAAEAPLVTPVSRRAIEQ